MTRIALIGAGLMGTGLARLFSRCGMEVTAFDAHPAALGVLCEAVPAARGAASLVEAASGADLVIEAVTEKLEFKQRIFVELCAATERDTILATNSSVIAVGSITSELSDRDAARCVGTHFWNPPDLIPLVEVIEGPRTAAVTVSRTMAILDEAGKEPVHVRRDTVPGNRLQHALWREALALVEEGVCSAEDVDRLVKRSFGLRLPVLGPLENADLVGLELTDAIHRVVLPTLSRTTTPSPLLSERISQGKTGVATGGGLYDEWSEASVADLRAKLAAHLGMLLD